VQIWEEHEIHRAVVAVGVTVDIEAAAQDVTVDGVVVPAVAEKLLVYMSAIFLSAVVRKIWRRHLRNLGLS